MNIPRITTQNLQSLPSIRVHEQNSLDSLGEAHSSPSSSHRSMPRDIPIPKYGSPTSARGSYLGSPAIHIPPILSLEPPTLPAQNVNNYNSSPSPEDSPTDRRENHGGVNARPRKLVLDVRERDRWGHGRAGSMPSPLSAQEPPSASSEFTSRSEGSETPWRDRFDRESDVPSPSPKDLPNASWLRIHNQHQQSLDSYDKGLLRKLNSSTSDPSVFSRHQGLTPPRDFRPLDGLPAPRQQLSPRSPRSPRSLQQSGSIPIHVPSPGVEMPMERWKQVSPISPLSAGGYQLQDSLPPFTPSFSAIRNSDDNVSVSSSHVTDDSPLNGESGIRRSFSSSLLGPNYEKRRSRGSVDSYNDDVDSQFDEGSASQLTQMRHLTLQEARHSPSPSYGSQSSQSFNARAGSKRRASSPPHEDHFSGNSEPSRKGLLLDTKSGDIYSHSRRTPPVARASPVVPKLYGHGPRSVSGSFNSASVSSANTTWSMGPFSAASSMTSAGGMSPIAFSPASDVDLQSSLRPGRQRSYAQIRDSEEVHTKEHTPPTRLNGLYMCECCPKKPKKFDNLQDLELHALEKQYGCQYCNNRFKNKNEAERHQNSLHLRKHSWSCAALAGNFEAAFHQSSHRPNVADVCGYCGKEFPLPAAWNVRVEHLTTEHKFGECNQSKKFYRADHFRQHLKHSHCGTSGKWTNVLENACMRDESPPSHGLVEMVSEEMMD